MREEGRGRYGSYGTSYIMYSTAVKELHSVHVRSTCTPKNGNCYVLVLVRTGLILQITDY